MLRDSDYIKETSLDFCKKQKLKEAMMKSVKLLNNSSFDEISTVINDAISSWVLTATMAMTTKKTSKKGTCSRQETQSQPAGRR